jgi:hypothetical protein
MTPENFWKRIQKPVGCWLFDGAKEQNGYGYVVNPLEGGPKFLLAHRLSWILTNGEIPDGLLVLHKCDIRACVNPDHLFLGTDADNQADKHRKDRDPTRTLKSAQASEIRAALRTPRRGLQKELADKYGVSQGIISKLKLGKTYKEAV